MFAVCVLSETSDLSTVLVFVSPLLLGLHSYVLLLKESLAILFFCSSVGMKVKGRGEDYCSVSMSWPTLCNLVDCSTQDSSILHNLLEFAQLMSIESVMLSNHLILCCPFLLPSVFPNIRVFSSESALLIRWPKYWSYSFSISPSNDIQDWFPLGWTGLISLQSKGLLRVFSSTTIWKHQSFGAQPSLWSNSRGTVYNLKVKSQSFSGSVSLVCHLHNCFSRGIAFNLFLLAPQLPSLAAVIPTYFF